MKHSDTAATADTHHPMPGDIGFPDACDAPNPKKGSSNLQDTFLNQLRKKQMPMTMFLANGVRIKGKIKSFDSYCLAVEQEDGNMALIYKQVISTIQPQGKIEL